MWSDSHTSLPLHKVVSVAMYDSPPLPFMCIQYMCSKQQFSDVSSASDALAYCFQGSSCWLCPLWLHDEAIHQRWARNWIHVNCDVWWHGAKCISLSFFLLFKLASTCKTAASCLAEGIGGAVHVEGDAWWLLYGSDTLMYSGSRWWWSAIFSFRDDVIYVRTYDFILYMTVNTITKQM